MTVLVKVRGGTNAGSKRPLGEPRGDWRCPNGHMNPGYRSWCCDCPAARPERS